MKPRLTKNAEQVMRQAEVIANRLNHVYVGTEHLLIALLEVEGLASRVLLNNGVVESRLIEMVEQLIAPNTSVQVKEEGGITPRLQYIYDHCQEEAEEMNSTVTGTEHL